MDQVPEQFDSMNISDTSSDITMSEGLCSKSLDSGDQAVTAATVTEVASSTDGFLFNPDDNSYSFHGMDALTQIISATDGNVEIFLLPNSTLAQYLYWIAQTRYIKSMAVFIPSQLFPVRPTPL